MDNPMTYNVLGSASAGIVSRILTHPLDTAKARLQAPASVYKGPMDALWRTFRTEGVRGLYRGFGAILVGGTPGTMVYLCSYEFFKERLGTWSGISQGSDGDFVLHFTCGMLAETIACIIYVPVDVGKSDACERFRHNPVPCFSPFHCSKGTDASTADDERSESTAYAISQQLGCLGYDWKDRGRFRRVSGLRCHVGIVWSLFGTLLLFLRTFQTLVTAVYTNERSNIIISRDSLCVYVTVKL